MVKDEERENARNNRDDNTEEKRNGGEKRCALEILLRGKLVTEEAACAGTMVNVVLDESEKVGE